MLSTCIGSYQNNYNCGVENILKFSETPALEKFSLCCMGNLVAVF